MISYRPTLHWCWPEVLDEHPSVRAALEAFAILRVTPALPSEVPDRDDTDILVPRLSHDVTDELIAGMPRLKLIATPSTGSDHIARANVSARGIGVITLRDDRAFLESMQSTAELAWLLILASVRRMRSATEHALAGAWSSMDVRGHELMGGTLGIIGLGRLGTMVARFGNAFGMRVIATDVRDVRADGVEMVSLPQLLRASDVVSLHVHLDESTRGLIGRPQLALMKPSAVLVNTSRGDVVDQLALIEALREHRLAAAAVDVVSDERTLGQRAHPLIEFARRNDHLLITPHIGGCTVEAQRKAFLQTASVLRSNWSQIAALRCHLV